ncbi:hypothetical protein QE152_g15933 [Popillia japonica]|uniref:Uncharacterized protein n=1 Tax=Popillia japonica TaxID=7064 RepID=A0AAW1L6I0_POPJA
MSHTFTLKSTSSEFSSTYYPPIELDPRYEYALGLIGLHTYNTIPNIHDGQNKFYYDKQVLTIPTGAYEVTDIEEFLQNSLAPNVTNKNAVISLKPNNSTQQCEITSKFSIDFTKSDSIGGMLGFSKKVLQPNVQHVSDLRIRIIKVITIRVECSIVTAAYYDGRLSHTLFEFAPSVEPGFSINIEPKNIIYLPINTTRIDNISLRLVDQDGDSVDFRGEDIVVRLELKKYGIGF